MPKPIEKPADKSELWRYGIVETYSAAFQDWIRQNEHVTIRPNESIRALEEGLSWEYGAPVRLYVPDF